MKFRPSALWLNLFLSVLLSFTASDVHSQGRPIDKVYPLLDASHSRWFYFSSASRPFGMVSLFPDTQPKGAWNSGYRYEVDTVKSISHIHEWQLSGIPVMPVRFDSTEIPGLFNDHASHFLHKLEKVQPGYHVILLERYKILAQLTATDHVGYHQYVYDLNNNKLSPGIILDLGGELGPSKIIKGSFTKVGNREIRGVTVNGPTSRRAKECPVFYAIVFSHDIKKLYFNKGEEISTDLDTWSGEDGKLLIEFDKPAGFSLKMKVGISFTSEEGAANNLKEIEDWNFYRVVNEAQANWDEMLGRISIRGGDKQQQSRFYTDLFHAIQGRRMVSDADGKYSDNTGAVRVVKQVPLDSLGKPTFAMYNSDSFWGAQWTLNTLWQLVYPEKAEEFCNSFVEYYKNGGLIPRGPSGGDYTYVMTGASSTPFFVSAWQKGIRGFDIQTAYEGLKKNHMPGGMMSKAGYEHHTFKGGGVEHYIRKGYVPYPLSAKRYGAHQDGAGMTLEYAYQDWCLAQLSKALGKTEDFNYFVKRSQNYKNLFNPTTGYMQPKDSLGKWKEPFDPLQYDNGFIEGNAAQFSWFVPHDLGRLFTLMGGKDKAIEKLNGEFELAKPHRFCNEHPEKDPKFIDEKRTWINYSNQPNSQAAFIFNHAGAPWLTQYWSREVVNEAFSALAPDQGYNGDEDQGLMGALSVLMKLGLFQMTGGVEEDSYYEIGSPLFDAVTISLNPQYYSGSTIQIATTNNSHENRYVQSAMFNDKPLNSFRIRHSDLIKGSKVILEMGPVPNKSWGVE